MPVGIEDVKFLNDREPEKRRGDSIKQAITRLSFNLRALKSPWAYVAVADPPVSWFQPQELKPSSKESLFSAVSVCSVGLRVLPRFNHVDWSVNMLIDWVGACLTMGTGSRVHFTRL